MKKIVLLFFVLLHFLSCKKQEPKIKLAVTSSLFPVFEDLVSQYELENNIEIHLIHSSSGKLSSQLVHGAPYDVFFSADDSYCQFIKGKLSLSEESILLAKGNLVKVSNRKLLQQKKWDDGYRIGIANPKVAPYGKLSAQFLESLPNYDLIKQKLVYGQNVNQILQYLLTENISVAFLSKANVIAAQLDSALFIVEDINTTDLQDIVHTYLLINDDIGIRQFIAFVEGEKGSAILNKYGYVPL